MRIHVLVYDGFDELDAIGPYEVFANAGAAGADATVQLATVEQRSSVTASHGLRVTPDAVLPSPDDETGRPDLLVVPGGGWNASAAGDGGEAVVGARAEAERGTIPDAVAALHGAGTTVAAVCTGGMLLAESGLLDGRPAVTHAGALDDLRATAAEVVDARVVDDGDVLTAGGVTSGLDLAFHVVAREFGADVAEQVATEMEYDPRGEVYTRESDEGA